MMKQVFEVWKAIKNYEGLYEVSNLGRVKSVERDVAVVRDGKPCIVNLKERIIRQNQVPSGHLYFSLNKGGKAKSKQVHKVVAEAFIPNPDPTRYTVVHHINRNPQDNRVENLMWMTKEEHAKEHANDRIEALKRTLNKRVDQIDLITGEVLCQWDSMMDVERKLNFDHKNISNCCNGGFKRKEKWINVTQSHGYVWKQPILE